MTADEIVFKLGYTYSFSFHSMYLDFSNWQMVNIAGQKSIDLSQYFGDSSVHIVVYNLDPNVASAKHRKCDKRYFFHCEIVNTSLGNEDAIAEMLAYNDKDEERDLGGSVFVRSGDVVPIVAMPQEKGAGEGGNWCLSEAKGYCVVRQGATPLGVNIVKVSTIKSTKAIALLYTWLAWWVSPVD